MNSVAAKYKADIDRLVELGETILVELIYHCGDDDPKIKQQVKLNRPRPKETFAGNYQRWFTESSSFLNLLAPGRLEEFQSLYMPDRSRKTIGTRTYKIQDYLLGIRSPTNRSDRSKAFDDFAIVIGLMQMQQSILHAVYARFDSTLFEIRSLVQADILDTEMSQAKELLKSGFNRAAGVIGGVVLEKHLAQVVANHSLSISKKKPTLSDFNECLKNSEVIDTATWRNIQWIGDIRNACAHGKEAEPDKDNLAKMLNDIVRLTKTLY